MGRERRGHAEPSLPFGVMRRQLSILVSILFLLAGCGVESSAGDQSPSTTETSVETTIAVGSTTTTVSPAATAKQASDGEDEFCDAFLGGPSGELDLDDPESVEATLTEAFEYLQNLPVDVPNEIADEWAEFLELTELSLELYEEYDYDLLAIPSEEMNEIEDQLTPSQFAIIDYCGFDDILTGEPDEEVLPKEAYAPPDVFETITEEIVTLMRSEASFDDVVAYYEDLLDTPGESLSDRFVRFSDSSTGRPDYLISVSQQDDHVLIRISVLDS